MYLDIVPAEADFCGSKIHPRTMKKGPSRTSQSSSEEGADEDGGTIECVVLNACETEGVGRQLLAYGVPNVVCWRSEVRDMTAMTFSKHFYKALDIQHEGKRDYKRAFKQAAKRLTSFGDTASKRKPAKHQAITVSS